MELQPVFLDSKTGEYVTRRVAESGVCAKQHIQDTANTVWSIEADTNLFLINTFIDNKFTLPNTVVLVPENKTLVLEFTEAVSGFVNIVYLVDDINECEGVADTELIQNFGINLFYINADMIN